VATLDYLSQGIAGLLPKLNFELPCDLPILAYPGSGSRKVRLVIVHGKACVTGRLRPRFADTLQHNEGMPAHRPGSGDADAARTRLHMPYIRLRTGDKGPLSRCYRGPYKRMRFGKWQRNPCRAECT